MQALRQPDDGFEQGLFAPLRPDGNQIRSIDLEGLGRRASPPDGNPQRVDTPGCAPNRRDRARLLNASSSHQSHPTSLQTAAMRWRLTGLPPGAGPGSAG